MITKKGYIYLYTKQEDSICIKTVLLKSMKISTTWCKKSRKKWRKETKQVLHLLKINGCAICGYDKCDAALDFHHSNPKNKKYSISPDRMAEKNLIAELNKCILLCCRCHREIEELEKIK